MREFFRGWRRKVGCVTLVVATVITGEWMRGALTADLISVCIGNRLYAFWSSCDGFVLASCDRLPEQLRVPGQQDFLFCDWQTMEAHQFRQQYGASLSDTFEAIRSTESNLRYCVVCYPWLAIPLTLLSAYLILWKPRKRTGQDNA